MGKHLHRSKECYISTYDVYANYLTQHAELEAKEFMFYSF